jgi:hypothetical protein
LFQKRTHVERLEHRNLLASDFGSLPDFRNPLRQYDVNDDGLTTAMDALLIINELNGQGPRELPASAVEGAPDGGGVRAAGPRTVFVDTNGDGFVTAIDALMVINKLNAAQGEQISIRVEVTDLAGNPVDTLSPGDDFQLRGYTQDLRVPVDLPGTPPEQRMRGVFSVYWDVNYDQMRVAVDLDMRTITYGPVYPNGHRTPAQITAAAGLLDDIGALAGLTPHGSQEELVFIVPMTATAPGVAAFSLDAEDSPLLEIAVFGGGEVPPEEIDFIGDMVTIGAQPTASIADLTVPEGNAVQTDAVLTVTLSGPAIAPTSFDFATMADTGANPATAGDDYIVTLGTVNFAVGETTKTIAVPIRGDLLQEPDETFKVVLSNAVGAPIADGEAIVTIQNDDSPPVITISNATQVEPTNGTADAVFMVTLSNAVPQVVTVDFATLNGTAVGDLDYTTTAGTLSFAPGETAKMILVPVLADAETEGTETFTLVLANATNAQLPGGVPAFMATGSIVDPSAAKIVLRLEARNAQGDLQSTFEPGDEVRIRAFVRDETAADPDAVDGVFQFFSDLLYNTALVDVISRPITFGPEYQNQQSGDLTVDGLVDEVGASAGLTPTGPGDVFLWEIAFTAQAEGLARFTTDPADNLPLHDSALFDPPEAVPFSEIRYGSVDVLIGEGPSISIADATIDEGSAGGLRPMTFTVSLSTAHLVPVSVNFATENGSAIAPQDYQAASGTVTFMPGETTKTITVNIVEDNELESVENFFVNLSSPVNADITVGRATGTIFDDEVRTISIGDRIISEGGFGSFTVSLSSPAASPVTVGFVTGDGTAVAGLDYIGASGTVTFAPGEQTQTILIQTLPDEIADDGETFNVFLVEPVVGAVIADGVAVGTISEVAVAGLSGSVYNDANGNGLRDAGEFGIAGVTIELFGTQVLPGGVTQQIQTFTQTDASGRYVFENLTTGSYSIHEIQPAFFNDGADVPGRGGLVTANDWMFVNFTEGGSAAGFNFGEAGLRPQFMGKRMFLATPLTTGVPTTINLSGGDAFVAFDAGFSSINVQAVSNTPQGASLALLDNNMRVVASATPLTGGSLSFVGNPSQPYFLRIGGGSTSVNVTALVLGGPNATGALMHSNGPLAADSVFELTDDWRG